MALSFQLHALAFPMLMGMSAASISCSGNDQSISSVVGSEVSFEGVCSLPAGGCSSLEVGGSVLYSWAATPIVGHDQLVSNIDMSKEVKFGATFRGFDNMIGEAGAVTHTFAHTIKCITNSTGATETQTFNVTVNMARSSPPAAALKPPATIAVGCLVEDVETRVHAKFEAPDASTTYRDLTAAWKKEDALPWVSSRPWSATQTSSNSQHNFDAGAQPIIQSISLGPDEHTLELVLKPPSAQMSLRGASDVSWRACIVPGDGFNYYAELCTETFPVRKSHAECEMASTTAPLSDAAPLSKPLAWHLAASVMFIVASASLP